MGASGVYYLFDWAFSDTIDQSDPYIWDYTSGLLLIDDPTMEVYAVNGNVVTMITHSDPTGRTWYMVYDPSIDSFVPTFQSGSSLDIVETGTVG
jgi:hypothetical protein